VDSSSASANHGIGQSVLTVTLNPALDRTYAAPGFTVGAVHRVGEPTVVAGGKGINVARVIRTLGGDALTTGFLAGKAGGVLQQALDDEGISSDFVAVSGETRTCVKIVDPGAGTQTELNEAGPRISDSDRDALLAKLRALLPGCRYLVLSGSLPPGTPADFYARIIDMARDETGTQAILDASGDALVQGIAARPFLAKPNVHELADLGIDPEPLETAARRLRELRGLTMALVTAGPRGAVLSTPEDDWMAVPPAITVRSAVGSGDSLTAGFLWALAGGSPPGEALALGVGAGAANAQGIGSGFCDRASIADLAARTVVTQLR
jgi:1-phosphofructokinase family hexose kinase